MRQNELTKVLTIGGMTCPGCELRIENALKTMPGMIKAEGNYAEERVNIAYDSSIIELTDIVKVIQSLDYEVKSTADVNQIQGKESVFQKRKGIVTALIVFLIIALIVFLMSNTIDFNAHSLAPGTGYGILFLFGLVTSLHCLFMCGSINLAVCTSCQTDHRGRFCKTKPSILYNAGRVVTCTAIGGIVGGIGSVVGLAPGIRGMITIAAGAFMVLMGLSMLNLFPVLRKIMPKMPKFLGGRVYEKIGKSGPFVVGLLNGFMPCGALQSMQIYALGTGSVVTGALSMFFFSAGTVPLMFGFGTLSSALSERFASKMIKVGAVMVMAMGLMMLVRGITR